MEESARGREVILEIVRNMRLHGEELLYSTIVPASYEVYLHAEDHRRLEGVLPEIVAQAKRALTEELARCNRSFPLTDRVRTLLGWDRVPTARVDRDWDVRVLPDANDELARGDIHVYSTLVLPETASYSGNRTRRIFTARLGERSEVREEVGPAAPPTADEAAPVLAVLEYTDEGGAHTHRMDKPSLVIGRGGPGYWVDLRLKTVPDVSREHVRLRHDPETGQFLIKDMSTLGTTVDGQAIPPSVEVEGEGEAQTRRDKNIEVPLPPVAVIGLAGAVFLHFKARAGAAT
jgi:hypothetical protein